MSASMRLVAFAFAFGVVSCAPRASSEPLPPLPAQRVVDLSQVAAMPMDRHFALRREIPNPCGDFPSNLTFGANSNLLRVRCLPDSRLPIRDFFDPTGQVQPPHYVGAPDGAPWRVAIDLSSGREIARLQTFVTCSAEFDRLEKSSGALPYSPEVLYPRLCIIDTLLIR